MRVAVNPTAIVVSMADDGEVPDPIFADPRLASIYDTVEGDRRDLDAYEAIVDELRATSVLDIGCGTGTLACRLAVKGKRVIGLDPAGASLDVARRKVGAEKVRWIHGDATNLPQVEVDLAVMTGNVAMVFLDDDEWSMVLTSIHRVLGGNRWLVFETRVPSRRAWEDWTRRETFHTVEMPVAGRVSIWVDLLEVDLPYVSFRQSFRFHRDDCVITSDSTLRVRTLDEIEHALEVVGFRLREVRDAPDRPGLEHVCFAQRDARSDG